MVEVVGLGSGPGCGVLRVFFFRNNKDVQFIKFAYPPVPFLWRRQVALSNGDPSWGVLSLPPRWQLFQWLKAAGDWGGGEREGCGRFESRLCWFFADVANESEAEGMQEEVVAV
jgi:hypothetical protein